VEGVVDARAHTFSGGYLALNEETAFIASSSVVRLDPGDEVNKNPLHLTSYGLGQLIADAIAKGYKKIAVGLGGTSTVDGGLGMSQALGCRFYDEAGVELEPQEGAYFCGKDTSRVHSCSIPGTFSEVEVVALCDGDLTLRQMQIPTNQKIGRLYDSDRQDIARELTDGLLGYANALTRSSRFIQETEPALELRPFVGSAGGILISLIALFESKARSGVQFFAETFDLEELIRTADLVITGEGTLDNSLVGKTPIGVCRIAKMVGRPVLYAVGTLSENLKEGFEGALRTSVPDDLAREGVTVLGSCHSYYGELSLPKDYSERVEFFREHNPQALSGIITQLIGDDRDEDCSDVGRERQAIGSPHGDLSQV